MRVVPAPLVSRLSVVLHARNQELSSDTNIEHSKDKEKSAAGHNSVVDLEETFGVHPYEVILECFLALCRCHLPNTQRVLSTSNLKFPVLPNFQF